MSEMVERVARATQHQWSRAQGLIGLPPEEWDGLSVLMQNYWRSTAHTAIEAMREPTEAMSAVGARTGARMLGINPDAVWRAMIDAALADQ